MKKELILIALGFFLMIAVAGFAGVPLSSEVQKTAGPITTSIPTVTNPTLSGATKVITGNGSVNLAYVITNEDVTNGIRCEYGSINDAAPVTTPTTTVGRFIGPGVSYVELIAPNNRLDCIPAAGSPAMSVTVYPK